MSLVPSTTPSPCLIWPRASRSKSSSLTTYAQPPPNSWAGASSGAVATTTASPPLGLVSEQMSLSLKQSLLSGGKRLCSSTTSSKWVRALFTSTRFIQVVADLHYRHAACVLARLILEPPTLRALLDCSRTDHQAHQIRPATAQRTALAGMAAPRITRRCPTLSPTREASGLRRDLQWESRRGVYLFGSLADLGF